MTTFLLRLLLALRWWYLHINPAYTKFYMDAERTEAHFFHAKTNSIHSNYTVKP